MDLSQWYKSSANSSTKYRRLEMLEQENLLSSDDQDIFDRIDYSKEKFSDEDKQTISALYEKYFAPKEEKKGRTSR